MNFETALADALHLNWAIPLAALPPLPAGLRYDQGGGGEAQGESHGYFSLVLLRQVGLHLRGASWLALSYPQVSARLCVRDAANTPSVLLLRQLVPGWVVPVGRLIGGQPLSAAVCDFPDGLPRARPPEAAADAQAERVWRWRFSAGARLAVAVELGAAAGAAPGAQAWEEDVSFFRDRPNSYWRQGDALRRLASEPQPTAVLPVRARLEQTDWLETFLPFVPAAGWTAPHSAFLVPQVQAVFAFDSQREAPVAAPMAAAG